MTETAYYIASFETTSATIETQKALKDAGITHALMPTPRSVQASCGLSIRFGPDDFSSVSKLISDRLESELYRYYVAVRENGSITYNAI